MGNQSCCVATSKPSFRITATGVEASERTSAVAPKKKAAAANAKPQSAEPVTTNSLAADAEVLRCFTERISARFPGLQGASEAMGATGGACLDAVAFEKTLRANLKYADSAEIERIFKLLDVSSVGSISEFELAKLFTGPELLRGLERQLKGKMSTTFVAFNRFRPSSQGEISPNNFQDVLTELLGYKDVALITTLFSIIDVNGKGGISEQEFKNFWNRGYPSPPGFYQLHSSRDPKLSTSRTRGPSPSTGRRQSATSGESPAKRAESFPKLESSNSMGADASPKQCRSPKTANMGRRRSCPSVHVSQNPAAAV